MFYAKVCGGHGLLYACTANINISTGRLSSSFRSDMTKLNVKKRAFEAPLKFAKVLKHPKVKKLPLQPHKKHSHFLCYVFFGPLRNGKSQPLGLPGQAIVSVQEAAGAQEVHGGRVTAHLWKGKMKFSLLGWSEGVGSLLANSTNCHIIILWLCCLKLYICLPHKSGCRRRQHWIKNSHDASFGFKWIWKITINSKFHSLLCCFQE